MGLAEVLAVSFVAYVTVVVVVVVAGWQHKLNNDRDSRLRQLQVAMS